MLYEVITVLLAFYQHSYENHIHSLRKGGIVLLDAVDAELVTAQTDLAECRAASEDLAAQVQSLTADMADRDAQIVALKAQIDAITQQPAPTPATIWGASSIAPGGSGTAAVQRVLDRWGSDIAVRLFVSGGFSTPDIPDGVKLLHIRNNFV